MNQNLEILSNIQRILNKINNDNNQVLIEKILSKCEDQIKDKEIASIVINRVFLKVNDDFNLLPIYLEIISKLSLIFQKNIPSLNIGNLIIELFYKEIINIRNNNNNQSITEQRSQIMNYSKFVGECYKFKIYGNQFLSEILSLLLPIEVLQQIQNQNNSLEFNKVQLIQIESLATIFAIAGKSIHDGQANLKNCEEAISIVQKLMENKTTNLPPRVRFMFKNLIELKNNKWVPPKSQLELDIQAQKEIIHLAQSYGKSINKTLQDKCGNDDQLQTIFWKKLFQSFSSQNYKIFKELFIEEKSNSLTSSPNVPLSPFLLRTITSPIQISLNNIHNPNPQQTTSTNNNNTNLTSSSNNNNTSNGSNNSNNVQRPTPLLHLHSLMEVDNPNLPNGFISPKISRPGQTSPLLSSIQKNEVELNPTALSLNNNTITLKDVDPTMSLPISGGMFGNSGNTITIPEEESNDLSIILSIIDSKIWNSQREIWKKKILNKIIPIRTQLKKKQKIEILAAIWQNMCDNQDEYGSYLDLCMTFIKMDEGEVVNVEPQQPPPQPVQVLPTLPKPDKNLLQKVMNSGGRRSSVATIQLKQQTNINLETRRSSISVLSELSRRGSLSSDTPSYCPPAPKLRSTPTLKSTPHKPEVSNTTSTTTTTTTTTSTSSVQNNINCNETIEPIQKKFKPNEMDSFYTVLIESLQDDFALKMFVKKKSLTVYMELLKDLYREFIIEIPLLLKCIALVHNGLYELSDEECTLLFDLEELAQEQKNLEDENKSTNILKRNVQFYQWKTHTWQEDQQSPPPPPSSFFDLSSDVFVL
ncbi:initiation factor eIF-4 gamma middle domain-containing protein [Tieghemostelium lacteum]|uniref:Initiation factor eIF-4 gamma middle domain-containing protein n=1 Tax=Tieghemostelium lacteum TaxID=361077 RepID=A0A152A6Z5_TIELA|nr:initiation factor eIF-4 gamma middle domain-containing protein [Tieghemostelium lacteum]|eukprot:KYR01891.1 initiation factor eIF-4 gamma middle domain-containing protein [Tieghemostelium lacteum]